MHVLIVDDREDNRYLLRALMQGHGHTVDEAPHGQRALELARVHAPDLVVCDLLMPVMDGYTLLRHWKADPALSPIPFIVYTATYTEPKDEQLALEMGADAFLIKPAEPDVFMACVADVMARAQRQPSVRTPSVSTDTQLKLYSEVLVHKLEQRSAQLEQRVQELDAARHRITRLNRLYAALSETNQAIVHTPDRDQLFARLCQIAVERGGLCMAWGGLLDAPSGHLVAVARCGIEPDWFARLAPLRGNGPARTPAEMAVLHGVPYLCNNLAADPALSAIHDDLQRHGFQAAASFPLRCAGVVQGSLSLFSAEADFFDPELLTLVTEMVGDVCFALDNFEKDAQRRQVLVQLRASEEASRLSSSAVAASANGIMITTAGLAGVRLTYVNPAFERITGYRADEVMGRDPDLLMGNDREQMGAQDITAAIREQRQGNAVLRNYRKDGSLFWNDLSIAPVCDDQGLVTHFVGIVNDITERKHYEEQLERQHNTDALTGLASRNRLQERTALAIAFAQRHQRCVALLFLDLDHFSRINDSLGYAFGDAVLRTVGERLATGLRERDTAARFGGDDFVVVLSDLASPQDVTLVANKILRDVERPITVGEREVTLSVSIGVSMFPQDGADCDTLLRNADAAMYRAKDAGRNAFCFYTADLNAQALQKLEMEAQLRRALERNQLLLHYQPLLHMASNRVTDVEALIRWRRDDGSLVSPLDFIPLAEETGLIVPVGHWVLRTACAQARQWMHQGLQLRMAVNLSACQFRDAQLVHTVRQTLLDCDLPAQQLKLEITESTVMNNAEQAALTLTALKALGVDVSVDDFGTGYSSLAYLRWFPIDQLKIDHSFVIEMLHHPDSAAIVNSIIGLARALRLETVGEGVETQDQRDFLQAAGCDLLQGYLFSRPITADALTALVHKHHALQN